MNIEAFCLNAADAAPARTALAHPLRLLLTRLQSAPITGCAPTTCATRVCDDGLRF